MKKTLFLGALCASFTLSLTTPGYAQESPFADSSIKVETYPVIPKPQIESVPLKVEALKPMESLVADKKVFVEDLPKNKSPERVYIPVKIVDKISDLSPSQQSFKTEQDKDREALERMHKAHDSNRTKDVVAVLKDNKSLPISDDGKKEKAKELASKKNLENLNPKIKEKESSTKVNIVPEKKKSKTATEPIKKVASESKDNLTGKKKSSTVNEPIKKKSPSVDEKKKVSKAKSDTENVKNNVSKKEKSKTVKSIDAKKK